MIKDLHISNNEFSPVLNSNSKKESNSYLDYIPFYILKQNVDYLTTNIENINDLIYGYFQEYQDISSSRYLYLTEIEQLFQTNHNISILFVMRNAKRGIYSAFNLEYMINFIAVFRTLFSLVIPIKYVPYVKICLMLEEPIDPRVFEFWIEEGFDTKETNYINFRKFYRKYLLKDLKENNIPIIIKKDIDKELYFHPSLPNFKRPNDYNNFIEALVKETIDSERINYNITSPIGELYNENNSIVPEDGILPIPNIMVSEPILPTINMIERYNDITNGRDEDRSVIYYTNEEGVRQFDDALREGYTNRV